MKSHLKSPTAGMLIAVVTLMTSTAALACANHGFGSYGYHGVGMGMGVGTPRFNGPSDTGMALEAKANYTVSLGEQQTVPFTVLVPANFDNAKVQWKSGEVLGLSGDVDLPIESGLGKEFSLKIKPSKAGQYVLRGKLSGNHKGQSSSKSAFILIRVVTPEENKKSG